MPCREGEPEMRKNAKDQITSTMDVRLPQPADYAEVLPADLLSRVRELGARRNTCPDQEVDSIDEELLALLLPYRTTEAILAMATVDKNP